MKITFTPSYIYPNKFSMSTNEPYKYQFNKNKNPIKVEPHSNTFNKINFYANKNKNDYKPDNLIDENIIMTPHLNDNSKKDYKKFLNKNLSNNSNILNKPNSKFFNSRKNTSEENNKILFDNNKQNNNKNLNQNQNQKEISGLNYQDLVNIVNKRKLMLEKNNYNQINNDIIISDDNGEQESIHFQIEEDIQNNNNIHNNNNYLNYEDNKITKEKDIHKNNELFSSISSINSNLKGGVIKKKNNNHNKQDNNSINSSEFDVVNTEEYKITKNEVTLNTETDFNIENNTEFKELIDLNTKDDFKIENNPETGSNSIFQDKTSLFESMINLNLQQSKSLISVTQKNDIEATQVEEYDQDKYKQQNETKEINFSSILNTTPNNNIILPNNNNINNNQNFQKEKKDDIKKDTLEKKINFFEDTIQQYPKKQLNDKIDDKYINDNKNKILFDYIHQEQVVIGKIDINNNNSRYENYFPKENKIISNSKIVSKMNENFNIKSPQNISERLKIPLPQKSSEHFSINNNKNNLHIPKKNNLNINIPGNVLSQRKNKFNTNIKTQENEISKKKLLNDSDGKKFSRSCSKNNYNSKKKARKIENYSDYYKKKVDFITKEETKSPNKENKINDENNSNKSIENNLLVINVNNSNPKNNLFYKLQIQKNNNSSRGTISENSKEKIWKHNKSTYY